MGGRSTQRNLRHTSLIHRRQLWLAADGSAPQFTQILVEPEETLSGVLASACFFGRHADAFACLDCLVKPLLAGAIWLIRIWL